MANNRRRKLLTPAERQADDNAISEAQALLVDSDVAKLPQPMLCAPQ